MRLAGRGDYNAQAMRTLHAGVWNGDLTHAMIVCGDVLVVGFVDPGVLPGVRNFPMCYWLIRQMV